MTLPEMKRLADPYRDLAVIDGGAPRRKHVGITTAGLDVRLSRR